MKIKKFVMLVASFVLSAACIFGAACTPAGSGTGGTGGGNTQQGDTGNENDDDKTETGDTDGETDKDDGTEPETPVTPNPDPGEGDGQEDEDDPTVTPTPDPGEDDEEEDPPVTPTPDPGEDDEENPPVEVSETLTFGQAANESAAFEWTDSSASQATVMYRLNGTTSYTAVDEELIRQISATTARVDVLGLKGNSSYDFRIETSDKEIIEIADVHISAYDRSGYAHFGATSGVGAYSNDGTLKSGAQVIYVTEETKNTVTAKFGNKTYTGIGEIMSNLSEAGNPVAIRVIGTISAATWNSLTGSQNTQKMNQLMEYMHSNGLDEIYQDDLIKLGYNTLNTSVYSELEGLSSKINYDEKTNDGKLEQELDSAYNNCIINKAENVTLEGVGEDAQFFQWGLTWKNGNSIEVRNITFDDYTEDACSFEGSSVKYKSGESYSAESFDSTRLWIHNNTFNRGMNYWDVTAEQDKHDGDGATDFKYNAYVTLSYNHYYNNHKTGLIGGDDDQLTANVTFHHNWYEDCESRLPLGRQANMHMYNNYYDGTSNQNMSLRAGAYAFIENCYFDNAKNPILAVGYSGKSGLKDKYGVAKVYNCEFEGIDVSSNYTHGNSLDKYGLVKKVTDRTEKVANVNVFNQNFDTDANAFYYADGESDVEIMHATSEVSTVVPQLAGTLHRDSNIDGGTSRPGDTEENPSTPGGDTDDEEQEQPAQPVTYTATVSGGQIVLSANAGSNFACVGGVDPTESDATKFSMDDTRMNLRGNSAYVQITVSVKAGQEVKLVANVASGSKDPTGIKLEAVNVADTTEQTAPLTVQNEYKDCEFVYEAAEDGTVVITIRRSASKTVYVKSITVTVS